MTTLSLTAEQVREAQLSHVGTVGRPNAWWAWDASTSDCLGFQTFTMGLRKSRKDETLALISCASFLAHTSWEKVPVSGLRPGDLVFQNWDADILDKSGHYGTDPEHVGSLYAPIKNGLVTTLEANTGPAPGVTRPNGMYKKTRPLGNDGWLLFGVRPLFAHPAATATSATIKRARRIGTWLNRHLPHGCAPTACGDIDRKAGDGIPGPQYWYDVQMWGRGHDANGKPTTTHPVYPHPQYDDDGIPGPRSKYVESILDRLSKA